MLKLDFNKENDIMETNLDRVYKSDSSLETEGIWFRVSEETRFLVKRFGGSNSKPVQAALAKYHKPYARLIEKGTIADATLKKIMAETFVSACLIDWEGVVIDKKDTPFDKDIAVKFFTQLPDLLEDLWAYATSGENYREELGNS